MDISKILAEMAIAEAAKQKALLEAATPANRPQDQANNGDGTAAPAIPDLTGGLGGLGQPATRPADNATNGDGPLPVVPVENVDPNSVIPDPSAQEKKNLAEAFADHMGKTIETNFKVNLKESSASIFESLQLDEAAAAAALAILEGAVTDIAKAHVGKLNEAAGVVLEGLYTKKAKLLEEKANSYMNTIVAEWVEENRQNVEMGIRTQIAESFMDNIKKLLESHYVELPAGKKDLYEAAIAKGEEILESFNAEKDKNIALAKQLSETNKKLLIESAAAGLVATKAEKFRTLAEAVQFDENFQTKLTALREDVQKATVAPTPTKEQIETAALLESQQEDRRVAAPVSDKTIERYASFLSRK